MLIEDETVKAAIKEWAAKDYDFIVFFNTKNILGAMVCDADDFLYGPGKCLPENNRADVENKDYSEWIGVLVTNYIGEDMVLGEVTMRRRSEILEHNDG